MSLPVIHNEALGFLIKSQYEAGDADVIRAYLTSAGALDFPVLPTGLFPAAGLDLAAAEKSGYGNVWVRDNVYVALAHEISGDVAKAVRAASALAAFFRQSERRFAAIVSGSCAPEPMNRPQVRFNGVTLSENPSGWAHAQNDALGYFLWYYCRLAEERLLTADPALLAMFALYFEAIRYWQDEDSGHWEERRKVEASSIGTVLAGLTALRRLQGGGPPLVWNGRSVTQTQLDGLIAKGRQALDAILPAECIQPPPQGRRYDGALLFLIYPLGVVEGAMAARIADEVARHLAGAYGIRRYLGDSYWTADYKEKVAADRLTADFSEQQSARDALAVEGEEAQWCIFDPILSVIFGRRYLETGNADDLARQTHYLNRSLGQITGFDCPLGALRCPEAYYMVHGRYVPNDQVPLLWTQANLLLALTAMERSLTV